jgi:hypothetical protein
MIDAGVFSPCMKLLRKINLMVSFSSNGMARLRKADRIHGSFFIYPNTRLSHALGVQMPCQCYFYIRCAIARSHRASKPRNYPRWLELPS